MQLKFFQIPALGDAAINEDINRFLRGQKVLQLETHLVNNPAGAYWAICAKYVENKETEERLKQKTDYRKTLDPETFKRFSELRAIRKSLSDQEGIPAFMIFHNSELAEMARLKEISPKTMLSVHGVGEKKIEKFGAYFFTKKEQDETSEWVDTADSKP